ncbi:MAG: Gfo/Idh/MocA family oxidoreductase [Thermomicrobiales bacterium]|nr:Gfo/Idh/MocA family oxidoreductase [Thermomicrobiales bacterium]
MTLRLAIAGCGVMGRRHVLGLGRLRAVDRLPFTLAAAIDPAPESAAALAATAAEQLGDHPATFSSLTAALTATELDAIDIVTAPHLHPAVAQEAFAHGLHVLVEKPIALTVHGGRAMLAAAEAAGRVLAVAENYRLDPTNRLAKALLDAGAIGAPYLIEQRLSGWGERVIITPWRHQRANGGIGVDMGVHYADMLEYLLGPLHSLCGMGRVVDVARQSADGSRVPADAEDLIVGAARFADGALASWTLNLAGRSDTEFARVIHGSRGTLAIPNDRTGAPLRLTLREHGTLREISPPEQLALVPEFSLDPVTSALFGGERLASYDLPWAETDANLLAIELADFAQAITAGQPPETDGAQGLRSLAIAYGFLEADRLGRTVMIDELLAGTATPYQDEIVAGGSA